MGCCCEVGDAGWDPAAAAFGSTKLLLELGKTQSVRRSR